MKVTSTDIEKFSPIELTILIETEDELKALWHRMNLNIEDVMDHSSRSVPEPRPGTGWTIPLWVVIDKLMIKLGFKEFI